MKKFTLFIGIDISKKWIDAALSRNGQKVRMAHQRFDNSSKGFKRLLKWIASQYRDTSTEEYLFCMEHTGIYTLPLCTFLQDRRLAFILEAALKIHRSIGIKRGKSDKADAKDIARYLYLHRKELKLSQLPYKQILALKHWFSLRARLVKYSKAMSCPANELVGMTSQDYALNIKAHSQEVVHLLKAKIKAVEKQMRQIIQSHAELKRTFELVTSVKGIGLINAVAMIIHTHCFKNFKNGRQFACYIGIAPFAQRSGSSLDIPAKVSHLANKRLKALLTQGARAAVQHDKQLRHYYRKKLDEGKNEYAVLNAVKNKLVHRVFAVVKRGTPFVEMDTYA